ncbi:XAC2610-related protein [Celerinatantimonas diazotrophica]|uniref:Uncharacterized protein n=1 Tax=Celerinatantimonas diazotrophica TaxID=412034 RepID=A0A4R1K1V6_9GAMM|nr:hypothetical protein [Celerinatantimonas diazotrophica]TCK57787.1 hypothetical protein EV690_1483 [Celerinatantimonas diazotrophica]CAG9298149.1 hypothetical protein CEDIAZO_03344 [Celerinatantimonas diazotrophica]
MMNNQAWRAIWPYLSCPYELFLHVFYNKLTLKWRLWGSTIVGFFLCAGAQGAQYSGTLGKLPITFQLDEGAALYFYDRYRTPIDLDSAPSVGQNALLFIETNAEGKPVGEFHLQVNGQRLVGYWCNVKTHQHLSVHLKPSTDPRGVIQSSSFKNRYIRVKCLQGGAQMMMIDKSSDQLSQQLMVESSACQSMYNVVVGDYNFDGFADFSTSGQYFAGPNTTRNYYLYQPQKKQYRFNQALSMLVTLSFNQQSKIVTSTNQCCAGRSISVDHYRWQANELKQVDGVCYKRNDDGELVAKARKACY